MQSFVVVDDMARANRSTSSHIYKFSGEKFEPFQALAVHKATGCVAYQVISLYILRYAY
jgi:hypothetical protein